ncbi:hypothetical protein BG58_39450 [Caballeronia jiangsuensis]|nr:hypothetical protein BG58_39450 [Caballeronia jiangsuensis]
MQPIASILPRASALDSESFVAADLVAGLLATSITDVEVVSRELTLSSAMSECMLASKQNKRSCCGRL